MSTGLLLTLFKVSADNLFIQCLPPIVFREPVVNFAISACQIQLQCQLPTVLCVLIIHYLRAALNEVSSTSLIESVLCLLCLCRVYCCLLCWGCLRRLCSVNEPFHAHVSSVYMLNKLVPAWYVPVRYVPIRFVPVRYCSLPHRRVHEINARILHLAYMVYL